MTDQLQTESDLSDDQRTADISPTSTSLVADVRTAGCGFMMGAADIVPGVSGGTVALILGVYERLVAAISQCNGQFLKLLWSRQWRAAAQHIDLRFVAALGLGIICGIGGLASLMKYLLNEQMTFTFAAFTGMIIASSVLVGRQVSRWELQHIGILILGIVVALRLVTLDALQNPPDTMWYMFLCGMVGITAMILPGISGAFILLLLNRYDDITQGIKDVIHGNLGIDTLLPLFVFGVGCITGLLSFSRVLRWLLSRHHDGTMALLCGFMIGSLYKLWPFQNEIGYAEKFKLKQFEHVLPESLSSDVLTALALCAGGAILVFTLDAIGNRGKQAEASAPAA